MFQKFDDFSNKKQFFTHKIYKMLSEWIKIS
jgi:hypothetical protein